MARRKLIVLMLSLPTLVALGTGCEKEVSHEELLLKQLTDPQVGERRTAALTLQESNPLPPGFIPPLIKALDDSDARVRVLAAKALANAGPDGRPSIPDIVKISQEHSDLQVRAALQDAIVRINSPQ